MPGDRQAQVSFTAPTATGGSPVTGYTVTAHDDTNASDASNGRTVSGATSPLTVTGLTNGDSYTFTVAATNTAGTGPPSQPSTPVTPATVPSAPTGVSVITAADRGVVSFSPPSSTGGSPITGYSATAHDQADASDPSDGRTAGAAGSPITVSGLTAGHNYTFTVVARNAMGSGPPSAASAPGRVGCQSATSGASATFTGIGLEQCYTVPAGVTQLRVRATGAPGGGGATGALASGFVPVSAGQTIYVEVGGAGTGSAGGFNGGGPGGSGDYANGPGGGGASDLRTCSVAATTCIDGSGSSLASRLLVAGGGGGHGGASRPDYGQAGDGGAGGAAGAPGAAVNLGYAGCAGGAGALTGGSAGCSDGRNSGSSPGGVGGLGYGGFGGHGSNGGYGGAGGGGGGGGGGFYGGGGGGGGFNSGGGGGGGSSHVPDGGTIAADSSGVPSVVIETADAPGAPSGVSAARGAGKATVSFLAPGSDNGSPVTGYTVTAHDKSNPGDATDGKTVGGSGSPVDVGGLVNGHSYTFTVTAANAVGTGPASGPSDPVTPADVPGAPSGVSAARGAGKATVSFSAPSDNGSPISGYTVTAHDKSNPGDATDGKTVGGSGSPIAVSRPRRTVDSYTFTVTAANAVGTGPASGPSDPVTPADVPGAPSGASAVRGPGRQRFRSWRPGLTTAARSRVTR